MGTQTRMKPVFIMLLLLTVIPFTALQPTTILLIFQSVSSSPLPSNVFISTPETSLTAPGPDLGITNWTNNHILNPGFEDYPLSYPNEWDVQINTDRYNWFATQPPWYVSQGTYSAGMQTRPSATMSGFTYIYQSNVDADMRNLTLSFDYYADSIASLDYDYFFTALELSDGRYIWYFLVAGQGLSLVNTTNLGYFQLFSPASTWNSFNRNVTADYLALGLFPGTIGPGLVMRGIRFYIQTGTSSNQWLRVFFDDVWLQNETTLFIGGSTRDGNFESGTFNPWFHTGNYDASYISKSTTAHGGVNSCNVTAASIGNASYGQVYQYPRVRISSQNQGSVSFWWYLTQENVGMFEYSVVQFQFYNLSGYFALFYFLSYGEMFPYSNTSLNKYILANDFNTTGSWQRFQCNPWEDLATTFHTNDAILNSLIFSVNARGDNSRVELLFDDIRFDARAVSDADYKDQHDPGSPILGWNHQYSLDFTVTNQGYGGGKAANCSLENLEFVQLEHDLNERPLNSSRETYFDVMWRIEAFDGTRIEFYLDCEDGKVIHYILGTDNWGSFGNTSNTVFYNVTGSGTAGSWIQLHRDLVHDYEVAFGSLPDTTLQELVFFASCDSPSLEVLLDDLYIYDDPAPRLSNPWLVPVSPNHNDPVQVEIDAEDQDLETVMLIYRINSGVFNFEPMAHQTSSTYQATIPGQPYNTVVEYFFQANDTWGMFTTHQYGVNYFSYTVADQDNPSIAITAPGDGDTVSGMLEIEVTATDTASGINRVEFRIDGTFVYNDTSTPYSHTLNTSTLANGAHDITATAYDNAGNSAVEIVTITVQNEPPTPPPPPPPPIPPLVYAAAAIAVIVVILVIVLVYWFYIRERGSP